MTPAPALDSLSSWVRGKAQLEIDLGCHKGTFLVAMAQTFPDIHFLGIERQKGRVEKCLKKISALQLGNVYAVQGNGLEALSLLDDGVVRCVHVSFPDPWPKRRHHSRRMVNSRFLDETARVLEPGGELRLMTDDEPYFRAMTECAAGRRDFIPAEWDDGRTYPETEFQRKFAALGKPVYRLALRRCDWIASA